MSEKHKCISCDNIISIYRAFCSTDCEEEFFKKYPKGDFIFDIPIKKEDTIEPK